MNNLTKKTQYRILFSNVNFANDNVLTHLYMPIIGSNAYQVYNWMRTEQTIGACVAEDIIQTHERLLNYLNMSVDAFIEARSNLEKYGLLTTYYDEVNEMLIYSLNNPMDVNSFLNDVVYKNQLVKVIGQKEYDRTLMFLNPIDLDGIYTNISAKLSEEDLLSFNDSKDLVTFSYRFNFENLFTDFLKDNIVLDLDNDARALIESFYNSKKYSYLDVKNAVKNALVAISNKSNTYTINASQMNQYFSELDLNNDSNKIISLINNEVINKRNRLLFTDFSFNENKELEIINWYKEYTFGQFYQLVIKEKPTNTILKAVNEAQNKYGFDNGLINLITDFVIFEIGKFNNNYFKKTCQTINNLNLNSAKEVINHLRKFKVQTKKNVIQKKEQTIFSFEPKQENKTIKKDPFNLLKN